MSGKEADAATIKKNVLTRLRKIEGQVRGIQNMVEQGKECKDILIQVRAVRSALKSTTSLILKRYLMKCNEEALKSGDPEDAYKELEKMAESVAKFIDG